MKPALVRLLIALTAALLVIGGVAGGVGGYYADKRRTEKADKLKTVAIQANAEQDPETSKAPKSSNQSQAPSKDQSLQSSDKKEDKTNNDQGMEGVEKGTQATEDIKDEEKNLLVVQSIEESAKKITEDPSQSTPEPDAGSQSQFFTDSDEVQQGLSPVDYSLTDEELSKIAPKIPESWFSLFLHTETPNIYIIPSLKVSITLTSPLSSIISSQITSVTCNSNATPSPIPSPNKLVLGSSISNKKLKTIVLRECGKLFLDESFILQETQQQIMEIKESEISTSATSQGDIECVTPNGMKLSFKEKDYFKFTVNDQTTLTTVFFLSYQNKFQSVNDSERKRVCMRNLQEILQAIIRTEDLIV
jgi:hypothetical protein